MATESIFRTIVLKDTKSIEAFVNAVDESARFSKRNPLPQYESHDLSMEELIQMFGEPNK